MPFVEGTSHFCLAEGEWRNCPGFLWSSSASLAGMKALGSFIRARQGVWLFVFSTKPACSLLWWMEAQAGLPRAPWASLDAPSFPWPLA